MFLQILNSKKMLCNLHILVLNGNELWNLKNLYKIEFQVSI